MQSRACRDDTSCASRYVAGDGSKPSAEAAARCHPQDKETNMTWTPPQAWDFRFGFEITMYVAAR